nr:YciI family protein [Rhodococcus sp. (in: high G+C Gram-positive bacteria)]
MISIHTDERVTAARSAAPGTAEFAAVMEPWMAYNQMLIDGRHWVAGASLMPTETATTIRRGSHGPTTVTDGPYAETKEQFGGFYVVEAADLDEAMKLASALPLEIASFEVRPVAFRPDAPRSRAS